MTIDWTHETEDGETVTDKLPAKWEICDTCNGNGKHSHAIGAITSSEWSGWDMDEQEDYFAGRYDSTCEECKGSGKVKTIDDSQVNPETLKAYEEWQDEQANYARQDAYERKYGY